MNVWINEKTLLDNWLFTQLQVQSTENSWAEAVLWRWQEHRFAEIKSTEYFVQKYRVLSDWKDCKKNPIMKANSLGP